MATIFTHPVIALALTPWFPGLRKNTGILVVGAFFTILPDMDVISFKLGIPYQHMFGHRGMTHSLTFAAVFCALIAGAISRILKKSYIQIWLYLFLCMSSHGALDALTNGGHGVAFFAPFSDKRYFFSFTPIEVSTLNIKLFFSGQAIPVLKSELLWVWIPGIIVFISGYYCIKRKVIR